MATSPKSKQNELGALPTIPTIQEMKTWDSGKVLRWARQRDPFILLDDDGKSFLKARITGAVFLEMDLDFPIKYCGISVGSSRRLITLMNEVLSGVVSSPKGKRKTVAPEPPTTKSTKRRRQEQEEKKGKIRQEEECRSARDTRNRIQEIVKDLDKAYSIQHSSSTLPDYSDFGLPGAVAQLSNPAIQHKLPFPFCHPTTPLRLKVTKGDWQYVGREKFCELLRELEITRRESYYHELWVYGTWGYGKSHLLAALVCYLTALDERVIYIPDCRNCSDDPVTYFRTAMLFTWTDKPTQDEILTLNTMEKIGYFLKQRKKAFFVIDQMDALNVKSGDQDSVREAKTNLATWIPIFISTHKAVLSSSANNQSYLRQQNHQNNNRTMRVYGGLTKTEMKCWWSLHSHSNLGGYCEEEIEELTGRVPLFLNDCVVDGEINLSPLKAVADRARMFTSKIREITNAANNQTHWDMHCEFVKACFLNLPVPTLVYQEPYLIDHRFFFQREDGSGGYSCDVARRAVAEELVENQQYFADYSFWEALPTFYNNPSTIGFFMEYAVLFYLHQHGLTALTYLGTSMEVISFKKEIPQIRKDIKDKPVIYHPADFRYKPFDGIIVFIETAHKKQAAVKQDGKETTNKGKEKAMESDLQGDVQPQQQEPKEKLFLYPYQVDVHHTGHKDSYALFYKDYDLWVENFQEFDVKTEFLWFTPDESSYTDHPTVPPSEGKKLRNRELPGSNGNPEYREANVSFGTLNEELGRRYEEAKRN